MKLKNINNNQIVTLDAPYMLEALELAIKKAQAYQGATWPNPPVGAVGLDEFGNILVVSAHKRAGREHAEVSVINEFRAAGSIDDLHTLIVTLEPCNHRGKTAACTEAILATKIKRVIFAVRDPNPKVCGGGAERLSAAGIEVFELEESPIKNKCRELIASFTYFISHGRPWLTIKQAIRKNGSMIPEVGRKTFTSREALIFAHKLRKRADAIITGSGTILADNPEFTVRHVEDHPEKKRYLVILDRRERVSPEWIMKARDRGFSVVTGLNLEGALEFLGMQGVLEALVEAGPTLSNDILSKNIWQERIEIFEGDPARINFFKGQL